MIAEINGLFLRMEDGGPIVVDVGGLGYRVVVSDRDRAWANVRGAGGSLRLFIRPMTNDAGTKLYGFSDEDERRAFDKLVGTDGIGPVTAMGLLSKFSITALKDAITARNLKLLKTAQGVGPKVAEKLLEVRL